MICLKHNFHEQSLSNDILHTQCKPCRKQYHDEKRHQLINQQKNFIMRIEFD